MSRSERIWSGNWRARILDRVASFSCDNVTKFMATFPAVPYRPLASKLGDDVAGIQLTWLQVAEAQQRGCVRQAVMDSLVRQIHTHLPGGWRQQPKGDLDTASVFAEWSAQYLVPMPELEPLTDAVWNALKSLSPPVGWLPAAPDDPLIAQAFSIGWPTNPNEERVSQ